MFTDRIALFGHPKKNKLFVESLAYKLKEELKRKGIKEILFDRNGKKFQGKLKIFFNELKSLE